MNVQEIKEEVLKMGACDYAPNLMRDKMSVGAMIKLMLDPKCLEFCMTNNYPSVIYLKNYEHELRDKGVFVDGKHTTNKRKIVIFGGDVTVNLKGFEVSDIYVRGGSAHIIANENSFAIVENWGGMVLHEGNVKVIDKI